MEACPCCRDWLARERAAQRRLARAPLGSPRAARPLTSRPAALRTRPRSRRCRRPGCHRHARPSFIRRWAPLSLAAALVLAVAAGLRSSSDQPGAGARAADDARSRQVRTLPRARRAPPTRSRPRRSGRHDSAGRCDCRPPSSEPAAEPGSAASHRPALRRHRRPRRAPHLFVPGGAAFRVRAARSGCSQTTRSSSAASQHETVMWSQGDRTYIIVSSRSRATASPG